MRLRSFGVWRHLVWEVYISVSEQPDTSIFMVKELVFWDATKYGLVEKYGLFKDPSTSIFWDPMPYSLVDRYQCLEQTCYVQGRRNDLSHFRNP